MEGHNITSNNKQLNIDLARHKKLLELYNLALITENQQEFFDILCREITILTQSNLTAIFKYEIAGNRFVQVSYYQFQLEGNVSLFINNPNTLAGYTFSQDKPVFFEDIKNNPILLESQFFKIFKVGSGISCTIKNKYGKWGEFGVMSLNEKSISKSDSSFFQNITALLSSFLEKEHSLERILKNNSIETAIRLTSGISHDFLNYLSLINNYNNLLQQDILEKNILSENDKIAYLNQMSKAITKAEELIKQLQNSFKNHGPIYREIDINTILIEMKDLVSEKLKLPENKRILVEYYLTDDSPLLVMGNSSQISQVILNLVINAFESIKDENGKIEIRSEKFLASNPKNLFEISNLGLVPINYVHLSIGDNGIGMDKDFLNNLFNPYVSGKKEHSVTGHNMGLGLSIVYGIIEQMKGRIKITSELTKGTKFDIYIPSLN